MKRPKGAFRPICTLPAMQKPVRTKKERHPEMTYKEAIDYLINGISDEAIDIAIDCIEKQIPKKPDYEGDGYWNGDLVYDTWICPNCGKDYEVDYDNYKYCPKCGQAIDLGGDEE